MKTRLSLRLDLREGGPNSEPLQYSVVGLVNEEAALIRRHDGAWTLLRLNAGDPGVHSKEGFETPEAALEYLQAE